MPLIEAPKSQLPPVRDPDARDKPLDYFWTISDESWAVIEPMLEGTGQIRGSLRAVIRRMVACGLRAYREQGSGYVSYSRSARFYDTKPYGGDDLFTYHLIRKAADKLDACGITDHQPAMPHERGFQSRYALRSEVVDLLEGAMVYRGRPELKLRDHDRNPLPIVDDETTCRLRDEVREMRDYLRSAIVTMPDCCEPVGSHHWNCPVLDKHGKQKHDDDGNALRQVIRQDPWIDLYRVFSRGDWALGGRWYFWAQSLSKGVRKQLRIDGEATVEVDYRAMHTRQLYAIKGLDYQGDPYFAAIDHDEESGAHHGYDRDDEVKPTVNIALNAKTERSAVGAIAQRLGTNDRERARGLMSAVKAAHPIIAEFFHSDIGLTLMRHESDIALAVMRKARDRGFFALPIHDSFMCQERHEVALRACMDEAWEEWSAQYRIDGRHRVVTDVFAVESEIVVPAAMEPSKTEVEAEVLLRQNPTLARAPAPSSALSEHSFFDRAMVIYGAARVGALIERFGSRNVPSFYDPADPRDVQREFGTMGLELLGIPFEEDISDRLHRAWGRDASTNPIPERLIKTAMTRANKRANRSAMNPTAKPKKAARKPAKPTVRTMACDVGLPVDPVVSSVLKAFPGSTVRAA